MPLELLLLLWSIVTKHDISELSTQGTVLDWPQGMSIIWGTWPALVIDSRRLACILPDVERQQLLCNPRIHAIYRQVGITSISFSRIAASLKHTSQTSSPLLLLVLVTITIPTLSTWLPCVAYIQNLQCDAGELYQNLIYSWCTPMNYLQVLSEPSVICSEYTMLKYNSFCEVVQVSA